MLVVPIRTETVVHRTPYVNGGLIALNIILFLLFREPWANKSMVAWREASLAFHSDTATLLQFFSYQFLHADWGHLLGNMVFLWVFGNSVNGKIGNFSYLLFYLAGGVFAAWGYAAFEASAFHLIGASGAVAAVTTAYLVLFPRSHVTVLVWFFVFLHFFEIPAIVLIGLKIIVWDNLVAPGISGPTNVAHGAHLAGYFFGFASALVLLGVRGVPRDQFDLIALWRRWMRRREFSAASSDLRRRSAALSAAASTDTASELQRNARLDRINELRSSIHDALSSGSPERAAELFGELTALDSSQCLSERHQLAIARQVYSLGRFRAAAAAYARFAECYPNSIETPNVRLLLGIVYARDLQDPSAADHYLTQSLPSLPDDARREQCLHWLRDVRNLLGRPAPDSAP